MISESHFHLHKGEHISFEFQQLSDCRLLTMVLPNTHVLNIFFHDEELGAQGMSVFLTDIQHNHEGFLIDHLEKLLSQRRERMNEEDRKFVEHEDSLKETVGEEL